MNNKQKKARLKRLKANAGFASMWIKKLPTNRLFPHQAKFMQTVAERIKNLPNLLDEMIAKSPILAAHARLSELVLRNTLQTSQLYPTVATKKPNKHPAKVQRKMTNLARYRAFAKARYEANRPGTVQVPAYDKEKALS